MKPYSEEDKLRLMKKVDELKAQGLELKQAVKRAGVSTTTYRKWKVCYNLKRES